MAEPWQTGWAGGRFRQVETTGDVGVEADGPSLPSAMASAAAGMYWIVSPGQAEDRGLRTIAVGEGEDLAVALARALQRALVAFDTLGLIGASCLASTYRGERAKVVLEIRGETFDPSRHPQGVEIKAVTHHDLVVDVAARRVEILFDV